MLVDGNLNMATNEERLSVNDTLIGGQFDAGPELVIRNKCTPRSFNPEAVGYIDMFDAAYPTFPTHLCALSYGDTNYT
jgi:hypothetical protein